MKFFNGLICIILFLFCVMPPPAFPEAPKVEVYTHADPFLLGRSENRRDITAVELDRFNSSSSLDTNSAGVATAVMVNASVKRALEQLLEDREFVIVEDSIVSRIDGHDQDVYGFTWERYGFEMAFAFDELNPVVISEIEKVYGDDAYLYGELKRDYDDNYAVRIFRAENVLDLPNEYPDFLEIMISATVIGSTFQPLLGIHDGLGVLDRLGLAAEGMRIINSEEYNDYREFKFDSEQIYSFLHSVDIMEGDFIDNLYVSFNAITQKSSEDEEIRLPEELFMSREGDNTDFALFYYDILKRKGYEVKYIIIDQGSGDLYQTTFFREKDADLWGRIDGNALERGKVGKWQRLPALVFNASVGYFEPDIKMILNERRIELPPPSKWHTSLY